MTTKPPDEPKPPAKAAEPVELQDEMRRVLFDHEMERGMTITKIPQPRNRRRTRLDDRTGLVS
jgi:hypothetical protein